MTDDFNNNQAFPDLGISNTNSRDSDDDIRLFQIEEQLKQVPFGGPVFQELLDEYTNIRYKRLIIYPGVENASSDELKEHLFQEVQATYILLSNDAGAIKQVDDQVSAKLECLIAGCAVDKRDPPNKEVYTDAEPVMMFNGQFVSEAVDLTIRGGGIAFIFRRIYKNQVTYQGPLGFNWDHAYNLWLRISGDTIFRSTGKLREDFYQRHPKFGQAGFDYWVPPDGQDGVILENGSSFLWRSPHGAEYIYGQHPSLPFLHLIERIQDKFGNSLAFLYQDGKLSQIEVNHPERFVVFQYDEQERICLMRDYTGRIWQYVYDDFGDLIAVNTQGTKRYPAGLITCYEYSSAAHTGDLQHNLTRIIDPKGQIYLENEFGTDANLLSFNRVVRQRQGTGERTFEYEDIVQELDFDYSETKRPAHQTTLIERNSQPIRFIFNQFGNLLLRHEQILQDGLLKDLVWRFRYDRDGALTGMLSPEGSITQYLYGREYFARRHGLDPDEDISGHDALDVNECLAHGRLLAIVQRGQSRRYIELDLTRGLWGDIFPDIFGALDQKDIVRKYTYHQKYGQIHTISDPRFTQSADPEHPESTEYETTVTTFEYRGPANDPILLLDRIVRPTPILPDGNTGEANVDRFPEYDDRGRLKKHIDPSGTVSEFDYFDSSDGVLEGHLHRTIFDSAGGLAITTEYNIDELGRVAKISHPRAVGAQPGQFETTVIYDELDQVERIISTPPFNLEVRRFYDQNGNLEREERDLKDDQGVDIVGAPEVQTFGFDEDFNLVQYTFGGANETRHLVSKYSYDAAGKHAMAFRPEGNGIRTNYDERLLPIEWTVGFCTPEQASIRIEYDGDGRIVKTFNARGHPTSISYDPSDRITQIEDPFGNVTRRNYDKLGNLKVERVFERRGEDSFVLIARSEFEYDELERMIRSGENRFDQPIPANNLEEDFLPSPGPGELLETKYFYFDERRIKDVVDPLSRTYRTEYDAIYRIRKEIDPLGNSIENHYDAHNNLVRRDVRDIVRDPISDADIGERIFSSSADYDQLDRLISATDSLGNITRYSYDSRGNLVRVIDPLGNVREAEFDIYGRLTKESKLSTDTGLGGGNALAPAVIQYEYDSNSNLVTIVDALGRRTTHIYDELDRHKETIYPDGTRRQFQYDADGHLINSVDNNGSQRQFTIDALGRIIRIEVDRSNLNSPFLVEGASYEAYQYDALGRVKHEENDFATYDVHFNSLGWPLKETIRYTIDEAPLTLPLEILRTFDNSGALIELTYPGGRMLRYQRDSLKRMKSVDNLVKGGAYPGDPAIPDQHNIARFFHAGRQRSQCSMGNGIVRRYQHDGAGRIIEISHADNAGTLLLTQQLYDAIGNLRIRNEVSQSFTKSETFSYDSFYRLVGIQETSNRPNFDSTLFAPASQLQPGPIPDRQADINSEIGPMAFDLINRVFSYDLVGNRRSEASSVSGARIYTINNLDQYTQINNRTFMYDLNGNMINDDIREYRYNARDQLVNVIDSKTSQSVVRFFHDTRGQRILELRNGVANHFVYNGPVAIAEYRDGALFAQYVNDSSLDRPLQIAAEGSEHWYHGDLLGSTRLLTDQAGLVKAFYHYSAFGSATTISDALPYNPFLYTGKRLDEDLGSYNLIARQYDPLLGRFLQRDPTGMSDGTNLYAYVSNNPLVFADPFGMEREGEASGSESSPVKKIASGGRQAVKGAAQSKFPPGTEGPYRLWSGDGTKPRAVALAKSKGGWVLDPPIKEYLEAIQKYDDAVAKFGTRLPKHVHQGIWDPPSRKYAILTGLSEKEFTVTLNNPKTSSVWIRVERKWLGRTGGFTGGLMKTSGLLGIYSASQTDNQFVQIVGMGGGVAEVFGGTLYTSGLAGGLTGIDTSALMRAGSRFARFGGGVGTVAVSGYYFIDDIKRGDVENGVGDGAAAATGVLVLFGASSLAALTGTFTVAYEGTRLIDEPLGISDNLSDRGVRVENLWTDKIGGPDWLGYGMGFGGATPILGIGVEGISWGVYGIKEGGLGVVRGAKWVYTKLKFW